MAGWVHVARGHELLHEAREALHFRGDDAAKALILKNADKSTVVTSSLVE
jgi:hypothetical protein